MNQSTFQYDERVDTRSLYIHWPFCPYKCHFCPFVALASHDQFMTQYHKTLMTEICSFAQEKDTRPLQTIYFGGGTPSTYPDDLLLDTFGTLSNRFTFDNQTEISIEVNPGTVRPEQLALWRSFGINRLSIGVQSLNDKLLEQLNRHQKASQVRQLMTNACLYFENISVDVILGLPGVTENEWKELLTEVVTWPIKHISLYFLAVHDKTPLYFKVDKGAVILPPDDRVVAWYYWSRDFLAKHGFEGYEISSFAKAGFECRHNTVYWERKPYKGFGLGACSFDGTVRYQNEKNLMKYMSKVDRHEDISILAERLTAQQARLERLMLGLRRNIGVPVETILDTPSLAIRSCIVQELEQLEAQGYISTNNNRVSLTPRGLVVENDIVARLAQ